MDSISEAHGAPSWPRHAGCPVTAHDAPVRGMSSIRLLSTRHAGRLAPTGYATAAVSSLTMRLLDRGSRYCCLYTDLANPTANSVYRRIGYQRVCDIDEYSFAG